MLRNILEHRRMLILSFHLPLIILVVVGSVQGGLPQNRTQLKKACQEGTTQEYPQSMPDPNTITVGRIRYQISFVPNPRYRGDGADIYSDVLGAKVRRRNVPESRVVYFDGHHARTEETNADYNVLSRSFELRSAGSDTITYCKEFRNLNYCVRYPALVPIGGEPPYLRPTGETGTIAGWRCSKGEYIGSRHLFVWYTDEIAVSDTTGAVLRLKGVPGLILQTQEIPTSDTWDAVERVTVIELSSEAPQPETFSVPANFRLFNSLDAARAEDRRLLDEKAAAELRLKPLTAAERGMFLGKWVFDSPKDRIVMEITRSGDNKFQVRTTVATAPAGATGRVTVESASMKGRMLMVEESPNYRLYNVSDDGRSLSEIGNDIFTFNRK